MLSHFDSALLSLGPTRNQWLGDFEAGQDNNSRQRLGAHFYEAQR